MGLTLEFLMWFPFSSQKNFSGSKTTETAFYFNRRKLLVYHLHEDQKKNPECVLVPGYRAK